MMPTFLDIILYDENILNKKNKVEEKNNNFKNDNNFYKKYNFEENKKIILDSFVNYPRLELIKKYKIQTYQFLMNKNYRHTFLKFLIMPLTFELCYNILLRKV
jgi:hypothetical protein